MTHNNLKAIDGNNLTFSEKLKNGYNPMIEGVRWTERYADPIDRFWNRIPRWISQVLVFVSIFLFGSSINGYWIIMWVHFKKYLELQRISLENSALVDPYYNRNGTLIYYITASVMGSYVIYFSIGGFLHWYFYVRKHDKSHEWKCQPGKFLSSELVVDEILIGSMSLFIVSFMTGIIAWYAANDGAGLTIYYKPDEYGWIWFFLQVPIIFVYQDYVTYWIHRAYHIPFLYKRIHKMHHKYKQPTAFSVTAIHPVEIMSIQIAIAVPIVVVPVHFALFYATLIYFFCHGIIDHSGITFKAQWWQPWQPDAIFHDNHHQYFHVNFGFNMDLWDKIHGTYRQKNRIYREDIFYGKGKGLNEATSEELARDIAERKAENPVAYRSNLNENELTEEDLKFELKLKCACQSESGP